MELMLALLSIIQGVVSSIMNAAGFGAPNSTVHLYRQLRPFEFGKTRTGFYHAYHEEQHQQGVSFGCCPLS